MQCLKSLYLNKHRPYLKDKISEEQLAKFARGHSVGKFAQLLFPGGVEMSRPGRDSALKTGQLIQQGQPVIYEACFIYDGVIVAVDILVKQDEGWNAYEVKSSAALSEVYFNDAYLQNYVLQGSGLDLQKFYLVHRDIGVELDEFADIHSMFIFTELDIHDGERDSGIDGRIRLMKDTLALERSPLAVPGAQCMYPYPCDFRGLCWKALSQEEKDKLLNINA